MDAIHQFLDNLFPLPKESKQKFLHLSELVFLKKNSFIFKAGDVHDSFFILKSGIARSFCVDKNGKEFSRSFFTPMMSAGSLSLLIEGKKSEFSYQCLTDCSFYKINFKAFIKITESDLYLSKLYRKMLETSFLIFKNKLDDLAMLNASERYLKLQKQIPNIDNLLPQYHIASYLNITNVQLSRIRKELHTK